LLTPKIGIFNSSGQVDLLFKKKTLIKPQPFMLYPTRGTCKADGLHLPDGDIVKSAS
jgi:urea transport system substrate-binding protein